MARNDSSRLTWYLSLDVRIQFENTGRMTGPTAWAKSARRIQAYVADCLNSNREVGRTETLRSVSCVLATNGAVFRGGSWFTFVPRAYEAVNASHLSHSVSASTRPSWIRNPMPSKTS